MSNIVVNCKNKQICLSWQNGYKELMTYQNHGHMSYLFVLNLFFLIPEFKKIGGKKTLVQDSLNVRHMFVLVSMVTPFCNVHQIFL